jgi:hypothetical protein
MTDDVYAAGSAEMYGDPNPAAAIVRALRQTWPWAAFLSVLAILTVVLELGMGAMMLAFGGLLPAQSDPFGMNRWIGLVYIVLGLFYIPIAVLMTRVAASTMRVSEGDDLRSVLRAVRHIRDWWIGMGVIAIFTMLATCGGIIAAAAGGAYFASRL